MIIDDIFRSDVAFNLDAIFTNRVLFSKFYAVTNTALSLIPFKISPMPGHKEGVTAAILAGYNLGIDGNIPKEKVEAAITAFNFLTSKEIQKKFFLTEAIFSAIDELYDDEEICQKVDCETIKKLQFVTRPSSEYYQFSDFIRRIEEYVYQHLYGNQTAEFVLEKVEDLTKVHCVSIKEKGFNNELGLSVFIFVVTLSFLIIGSLGLLYAKKYNMFFSYLSKDSWIISIFGLIVLISNCYTTFGPVTVEKCHLYIVLLVLGYLLNLLPILHKMIIDFPEKNKFVVWVEQHKYYFFLLFLLPIIIIYSVFSKNIYDVKMVIINEGKNFEECNIKNTFGVFLIVVNLLIFLFLILAMLLLCYIEWGHKTVVYDLHTIVIAIYFDATSVILLFIMYFIQINYYLANFFLRNMFTIIPVIANYIIIYCSRLYLPLFKMDEQEKIISNLRNKQDILANSSINENTDIKSNITDNSSKNSSFLLKIRNYHNQSMESKSANLFSSSFNTTSKQNTLISASSNNNEK